MLIWNLILSIPQRQQEKEGGGGKEGEFKKHRLILETRATGPYSAFLLIWGIPICKSKDVNLILQLPAHWGNLISKWITKKNKRGGEGEETVHRNSRNSRKDGSHNCITPYNKYRTKTKDLDRRCLMKWGVAELSFALLWKQFQLRTARAEYQLND